ncbi:MAG: NUDIX hydrolase [Thermoflavifilum sp.]|jgi:8-oxo-dGTP pyrophosphatase MutT (NUDIX family)|uniref:NUDIX domain-containing protein n=1 Tax=Thermoflavifilum sp. TaxID=1968839 RepID=UPI0018A622E1|nr:NUDIX hydrolase [Thermoflavifilum sp.]QOR75974.1 MAG: NUDIX hydrolase [Thermoflavifilum sp.]
MSVTHTAETNPWLTTGERMVYDNPWIRVTEYQVIRPSGNPGIYGVVHFKNLAIGVVPMDADGQLWLVGQYRYPLKAYSWEIPEGGGPLDVDPLISAQRELLEETGIRADRWDLILTMHLSNSVSDEQAFVYLATGLSYHDSQPEETEQLQLRRVSLDAAYADVVEGRITDSISVAAILRLMLMKKENRLIYG